MRVFVSHAPADTNLAKELAGALESAGFSVWNPESVLPGDNWRKANADALESSDIMVPLWTRAANGIETLRKDVQFAMTSGHYRGRVVPVLVDFNTFQAGADVPWILLKMDPVYIHGHDSADLQSIVTRVRAVVEDEANAPS